MNVKEQIQAVVADTITAFDEYDQKVAEINRKGKRADRIVAAIMGAAVISLLIIIAIYL